MTTPEKPNVFRYVKSIDGGYDLPIEADYNVYLYNRSYSNFPDTILFANEINKYQVDPQMHYDFMRGAITPAQRWAKWHKPTKHSKATLLSKYYDITMNLAYDYVGFFSQQEFELIEQELKELENE